jgi:hypothetical protein
MAADLEGTSHDRVLVQRGTPEARHRTVHLLEQLITLYEAMRDQTQPCNHAGKKTVLPLTDLRLLPDSFSSRESRGGRVSGKVIIADRVRIRLRLSLGFVEAVE